jgi:MoaD family protein
MRVGDMIDPTVAAGSVEPMALLRLFASAREAAGRGRDAIAGDTVGDVLAAASDRYGDAFAALLPTCKVWVNGEPADAETPLDATDEVAVLPPVSGG